MRSDLSRSEAGQEAFLGARGFAFPGGPGAGRLGMRQAGHQPAIWLEVKRTIERSARPPRVLQRVVERQVGNASSPPKGLNYTNIIITHVHENKKNSKASTSSCSRWFLVCVAVAVLYISKRTQVILIHLGFINLVMGWVVLWTKKNSIPLSRANLQASSS
jgi:hypothetical protein